MRMGRRWVRVGAALGYGSPGGSVDIPSWDGDPGGTAECTAGPFEAGRRCWLTACHVAGTHGGLPADRGGPWLQHLHQHQLICPGSCGQPLTPVCLTS